MDNFLKGFDLSSLSTENLIIAGILILIVLALLFKLLWKSGLFLLFITFLADKIISYLPFNLYQTYPKLRSYILYLYLFGILIFIIRFFFLAGRRKRRRKRESYQLVEEEDEGKKGFFALTGSGPFFVMLLVSLIKEMGYLSGDRVGPLTSISFLYMLIKSLKNVRGFLKEEKGFDAESLSFDIDDAEVPAEFVPNSNEGRIRRESQNSKRRKTPTYRNKKKYNFSEEKKEILSTSDILDLLSGGFDQPINKSSLTLQNLSTGREETYISSSCIAKISEKNGKNEDSYLVSLIFKDYNDYDYGRFIDLLLEYKKKPKDYKLKLLLTSGRDESAAVAFYDPKKVRADGLEREVLNQGNRIDLIFAKYKINFIENN